MPTLSNEKIKKISEQILFYLYSIFPSSVFTVDVAKEIARDEEFTKEILQKLHNQGFVVKINKNCEGIPYKQRIRWRLSNKAHRAYDF